MGRTACSLVHLSGYGLDERETRGQKKRRLKREGNKRVTILLPVEFYSALKGYSAIRSICKQLV